MGHHSFVNGWRVPVRDLIVKAACVALAAGAIAVVAGLYRSHNLRSQEESAAPAPPPPAVLFHDWPKDRKPDLVLVLSGQEHGYLQPCGCSRPQLGGLARRYNFLMGLKDRGWPVVPVDLGDLFDEPKQRGPQAQLKYKTSMEALHLMGYAGVAVGQYETANPTLLDVLAEYSLNMPQPPVLATNLLNKDSNFVGVIKSWTVSGDGKGRTPKVGIAAIVSPSVAKTVQDPSAQFAGTMQVLPRELKELQKQNPDLLVLLYQGTVEEAKVCAAHFPQLHVVFCLSAESEPSDRPERVGETLVIHVGHKGRFVGVVGAYRGSRPQHPWELRYQLAPLGEEFETPDGHEKSNPIVGLMEKYAQEVKDGNYLSHYPQRKHPLQVEYPEAAYVGSAKCESCHEHAFEVWKKTPHAHAYHSLETATRPALRQFDGECVACHVVGFGYQGGFTDEKASAKLKDVGCESCHGPGSLHVKGNHTPKMIGLMNPFREKEGETAEGKTRRLNLMDQSCQQCHDQDNDVHWDFKKKWPLIAHPN